MFLAAATARAAAMRAWMRLSAGRPSAAEEDLARNHPAAQDVGAEHRGRRRLARRRGIESDGDAIALRARRSSRRCRRLRDRRPGSACRGWRSGRLAAIAPSSRPRCGGGDELIALGAGQRLDERSPGGDGGGCRHGGFVGGGASRRGFGRRRPRLGGGRRPAASAGGAAVSAGVGSGLLGRRFGRCLGGGRRVLQALDRLAEVGEAGRGLGGLRLDGFGRLVGGRRVLRGGGGQAARPAAAASSIEAEKRISLTFS